MSQRKSRTIHRNRWIGQFDGVHAWHAYGWAVDTQKPDARVLIEVCLDGEPIAAGLANVAWDALENGRMVRVGCVEGSDICHGFMVGIPHIPEDEIPLLSVRIANTDHVLEPCAEIAFSENRVAQLASHVFSNGGLQLHGWVSRNSGEPKQPQVLAFIGSQCVATAEFSKAPPLHGIALPDGAQAFRLDLPLSLADGTHHEVRVVDKNGNQLQGSPIEVCTFAQSAETLVGESSPSSSGLLTSFIKSYQDAFPRGLGWSHYEAWNSVYEAGVEDIVSNARVCLLVYGAGSDEQRSGTFESLQQLNHASVTICDVDSTQNRSQAITQHIESALIRGCDIISWVRVGDWLAPHALSAVVDCFKDPLVQAVYTDVEVDGRPWFKPAWNPEYALATDCPLEWMLVRASTVADVLAQGGSIHNIADLAWHVLAHLWQVAMRAVVHVPRVLYRCQIPLDPDAQAQRLMAARAALARVESGATLESHPLPVVETNPLPTARRLKRPYEPLLTEPPAVTLIIPTRDRVDLLSRCIDSIQRTTANVPMEIVVVDNDSVRPETHSYLRNASRKGIKVLPFPGRFNFAAMNNLAVGKAHGGIVGLINNDIEALHEGWLEEMLSHFSVPSVGAVGAKLLWPNGMVQHGGVWLGMNHGAGHFGNLLSDTDWGEFGRNQLVQQVSAVTAACLLVRKTDYVSVGGLDEDAFPVAFNDVDFCLKLRSQQRSIIWTPFARLLHAESASRGREDTPAKKARERRELRELRRRWSETLLRDPAYHPSLTLDGNSQAFGGLALPPRDRHPRHGYLWGGRTPHTTEKP